ncbi:hypothetical protein M8J77_019144 [Diaphorina citri]|jgi:hypothetical protein|nr:hypothetical protein M8J77_019144 [Diaphorina citri]
MTETITNTSQNNEDADVNSMWDAAKSIIIEAANEQIGQKEWRRNHEWFDDDCKQIIDQNNMTRERMMNRDTRNNRERYRSLRKESKKILRRKKKSTEGKNKRNR